MRRIFDAVFGAAPDGKFGTFGGVFTPSVLTILGVILYLRLGWVVGHAGLWGAVVIVLAAHVVTTITSLSISAIATNRTVGTGGAYFMLSRSLGADIGGAIGVPLFFAQALSYALYIIGFTEALRAIAPGVNPRIAGAVVCVALTGLSLWSASVAIKTQYLVMAAIVLSLVSFVFGPFGADPGAAAWPTTVAGDAPVPLATVFAVFFPAVTGITAGISMSGDLRDPRRAIPRGTLAAVAVGLVVYLGLTVLLGLKASTTALRGDFQIMQHLSLVPGLVLAGVMGATLSSAVGTVLGAPRTLQALARDRVVPRFLGRGSGDTDAPRIGTVATFGIALGGVLLGDLDLIAPILTMFFLVTYGMLNLACALERWANSPSYQPELRVPAWVSLVGALLCFGLMFFIHVLAAAVALGAVLAIWAALNRRAMRHSWGDARHALWAALVRTGLLGLREARWHPRNWRPNVVVLGGPPAARTHLADLGAWIGGDKGLVTYFRLVEGPIPALAPRRAALEQETRAALQARHPQLLSRVDLCGRIYDGVRNVAQSYGLAGFQANTVILGWSRKNDRARAYTALLRDLVLLDKSLILVDHDADRGFGRHRRIDVWWGGLDQNGGLMLLLARLLREQPTWRDAEVRFQMIVDHDKEVAAAEERLEALLREAKVRAQRYVHVRATREVRELIGQESAPADLVILGLRRPPRHVEDEGYVSRVSALLRHLPTTLLVRASGAFEGAPMVLEDATDEGNREAPVVSEGLAVRPAVPSLTPAPRKSSP